MDVKTATNEDSSPVPTNKIMGFSVEEGKESSTVEDKNLATLNSCMLADEQKGVNQLGQETNDGHSGYKTVEHLAKGIKRKSVETCNHSVEIRHCISSSTSERFAEEVQGRRGRPSDSLGRRSGRRGGDGSRSEKRKRIAGSVLSKVGHSGGKKQDIERDKLSDTKGMLNGRSDHISTPPNEESKVKDKISHYDVNQERQKPDRSKGKAASLVPEWDRSRAPRVRSDRDGEYWINGRHSRDRPEERMPDPAQKTRSEVRQSMRSEKTILSRVSKFGKRNRDHESGSIAEHKKGRTELKRSGEEVVIEGKRGKYLSRERRPLSEDCEGSRDAEEGFKHGTKCHRAIEVQREIVEERRWTKTDLREEHRKRVHCRQHGRDMRQDWQVGSGKIGVHDVPIAKHGGSRHFPFHRKFGKDGLFKGNTATPFYRQRINHGPDYSRKGGNQDVKRDAYRLARRVGNDKFVRRRSADDIGIKRSMVKTRGIDEGPCLFSPNFEKQNSGNPDMVDTKDNIDHISREVKGGQRPGSTGIEGVRHETSLKISKAQGVADASNKRCSSKVVLPVFEVEKHAVAGNIDQGNAKGRWQGHGLQDNDGKDDRKQNVHVDTMQLCETMKSHVGEAFGTSKSARLEGVELDHGLDIVRDMLDQNESNSSPRGGFKYSDKRKRKRGIEIADRSKKLRASSSLTRERPATQDIQEIKSSLEQDKEKLKMEGADKQQAFDIERDVQEVTKADEMTLGLSAEVQHLKPVRDIRERKEKLNELSLRRHSAKVDRLRDGGGADMVPHEHKHRKHRGSPHSVSPNKQKHRHSPDDKEHRKSASPRRYEKDRIDWEKFEKERSGTLAAFDSRYRRFGGGTSGLGGYSPRRRRSEAAIKTPSPPPRSPERRKPRAWDLPPPGLDSSLVAAISAAHQAAAHQVAVQHAVVTLAAGAPLVPGGVLVPPVVTPTSVSSGVATVPSMRPSLLQQVSPAVTAVTLTQATRPLRRLYVGNVPATVSDGELLEFMNAAMLSANANHLPGTKPCINCSVNVEKSYAFAEFITPEDATAALAFDGVTLHGTTLKIRRPKDFVLPANGGAEIASPALDMVSSSVADSPNKVFVGGISSWLTADKVKEIVTAFGQLKAYHWEVDYKRQPPQAFAFLEYMDPAATLKACAGLNGMRLGAGFLTVVQATPDAQPQVAAAKGPFYGIPEHAKNLLEPPTRVLELQNLVTREEVPQMSKEETKELIEDIRLECARFGNVKSTHMVQPSAYPEPGKELRPEVQAVSFESFRDHHLVSESVHEAAHEEVAMKDIEEQLSVKQQTAVANQCGLVKLQDAGLANANEQMLDKDIAGYQSYDQLVEDTGSNEKSLFPTSKSGFTGTEFRNQQPVIKQLSKEMQPKMTHSEVCFTSSEVGLQGDAKRDTASTLDLISAGSQKELDVSMGAWEILHAGKIYVEFSREESACQAAHSLHGRTFAGHKVAVCYFPLKLYQKRFQKGLGPRTLEEKQALALAVQGHLTAHIKD